MTTEEMMAASCRCRHPTCEHPECPMRRGDLRLAYEPLPPGPPDRRMHIRWDRVGLVLVLVTLWTLVALAVSWTL